MLVGPRALTTSPADIARASVLRGWAGTYIPDRETPTGLFAENFIGWEPEYRVSVHSTVQIAILCSTL